MKVLAEVLEKFKADVERYLREEFEPEGISSTWDEIYAISCRPEKKGLHPVENSRLIKFCKDKDLNIYDKVYTYKNTDENLEFFFMVVDKMALFHLKMYYQDPPFYNFCIEKKTH